MKIIKLSETRVDDSPAPTFIGGKVSRHELVGKDLNDAFWLSLVRFEAGARTLLHAHDFIQVLYVTEGKGILATREEAHEVEPGTVIVIPPGEAHWHGATAETAFAHLAMGTHGETEFYEE